MTTYVDAWTLSRFLLTFNRDGLEVAVAYFRAGYTPVDYTSEDVSALADSFFKPWIRIFWKMFFQRINSVETSSVKKYNREKTIRLYEIKRGDFIKDKW